MRPRPGPRQVLHQLRSSGGRPARRPAVRPDRRRVGGRSRGVPAPPRPPDRGPVDEDWRTSTAERVPRPAVPRQGAGTTVPVAPATPRIPPAAVEPPPPPRFPLFADEVEGPAAGVADPVAEEPAPQSPAAFEPVPETLSAWAQEDADAEPTRTSTTTRTGTTGTTTGAGARCGSWARWCCWRRSSRARGSWARRWATTAPRTTRRRVGSADPAEEPVDHTADATAEAPRTAPSTEDVDGNPTSYDASNMLDGVPETAWRAAGDGSGLKLVFTFPEKVRISEVGLINGYAKTATDDAGKTFDWYAGHRRITQVTWNFGVGTRGQAGPRGRPGRADDRGRAGRDPQARAQDRRDDRRPARDRRAATSPRSARSTWPAEPPWLRAGPAPAPPPRRRRG